MMTPKQFWQRMEEIRNFNEALRQLFPGQNEKWSEGKTARHPSKLARLLKLNGKVVK